MSNFLNLIDPDKTTPIGDLMLLEIVQQPKDYEAVYGFHVLERHRTNSRSVKAKILKLGHTAGDIGIAVGDHIMFDAASTFGRFYNHIGETVLTRSCNIICKLDDRDNVCGYGSVIALKKLKGTRELKYEGTDLIIPERSSLQNVYYTLHNCPSTTSVSGATNGDYIFAYRGKTNTALAYGSEQYLMVDSGDVYAVEKC